MLKLLRESPYPGIVVENVEGINHWCKKIHHRLEKKKKMKNIVIDGKKGISRAGRLTEIKTFTFLNIYSNVVRCIFTRYDDKF